MELTASNSNTTVPKRGTRHGICALRQALMGPHFGVLWVDDELTCHKKDLRRSL